MAYTELDKKFTARKLEIDPVNCDFAVRIAIMPSPTDFGHNPYRYSLDFERKLIDAGRTWGNAHRLPDILEPKLVFPIEGAVMTNNDALVAEYPLLQIWDTTAKDDILRSATIAYLLMRPQSCAQAMWTLAFDDLPKEYAIGVNPNAYMNALTLKPLQDCFSELKKVVTEKKPKTISIPIFNTPRACTEQLLKYMAVEALYMNWSCFEAGIGVDAAIIRDNLFIALRPELHKEIYAMPRNPKDRIVAIENFVNVHDRELGLMSNVRYVGTILSMCRWSLNTMRVKQATLVYNNIVDILPGALRKAKGADVNPFAGLLGAFPTTADAEAEGSAEPKGPVSGFTWHEDKELSGTPRGGGSSVRFVDDGVRRRYGMYDMKVNPTPKPDIGLIKYNAHVASYSATIARFGRKLREIRTYNTGGKMPGMDSGKLDRKNLYKYRTTKKIFYNNTYKQREHDLAVGVLLDESGSMCGEGIENGRAALILMHEVLTNLNINHCIAGHTSSGNQHNVIINPYVWFRENKNHTAAKCTALATIGAKSGNCDSGALYFMEQELMKTHNSDKLCLIFSDGAPTECTEEELKAQVEHMEKRGIKVIGIGVDFPSIAKYYKDHANGTSLLSMLDITCDILQRYILEKDS